MQVAIIKYNAGNILSVEYALKRLGINPLVTSDKDSIRSSDKVIFPGVGEAKTTIEYLKATGMDQLIVDLKQPVLGICLGMQLMCRFSEEGNVDCLNIFETTVKHFISGRQEDKVPHMGWNEIYNLKGDLFQNLKDKDFVYFLHSFYVPVNEYTVAEANYIQPFSAALKKDNFYATQFHPEKSSTIGEAILRNFLNV